MTVDSISLNYERLAGGDFGDHNKSVTVEMPLVRASSAVLAAKIQQALSYAQLGIDLDEEIFRSTWLETLWFSVLFQDADVLSVRLSAEGSAAYPSSFSKKVNVDLSNGRRLHPELDFTDLPGLTAIVAVLQQQEVHQMLAKDVQDSDSEESNWVRESAQNAAFTEEQLTEFSVNPEGITFHFDYGFPHVMRSLQPDGEFFFPWAQMAPFLQSTSPLKRLAAQRR